VTSLSLLTPEVYYRYLSVYQHSDSDPVASGVPVRTVDPPRASDPGIYRIRARTGSGGSS
jgi:hypothetical protein